MITRKEIESYPIGDYAIKEMDRYLHCIPGIKFSFPSECEYVYLQSKNQVSSTKVLYEYMYQVFLLSKFLNEVYNKIDRTIIPNNLSNCIKLSLTRELDLQDILKKSNRNGKVSSSRTPYNLGRKFSSLNTLSVQNEIQAPCTLHNISNITSVKAEMQDSENYMNTLQTKSTKDLLKTSCSTSSIFKGNSGSVKHSNSKPIKFPKPIECGDNKKDYSVMTQYKEPEMSFNYSINNKSKINASDERISKMDIDSEQDKFQVQQEIELTKKELQKLDDIRSQLIWVDRERIKRRLGLRY